MPVPKGGKKGPTPEAAAAEGEPPKRNRRKIDPDSIGAKYYKKRGPAADPNSGRQKRLREPAAKRTDPKGPQLKRKAETPKKTKSTKKPKTEKQIEAAAASAGEIAKVKLRNRILALREGGATIRQISDRLTEDGEKDCAPTTVFNHLQAGLDELMTEYLLNTKQFVQLRLNQMYRVELAHYRRLCEATDADDIEKLSRAMDRVWKRMDDLIDQLTGNSKNGSVKVEVDAPTGPMDTTIRVILPAVPDEEEEPDDAG